MTLKDILTVKGATVYTIGSDATLAEVADKLVEHKVGALLVCDRDVEEGEKVVGIITERDILHFCAQGKCGLGDAKVSSVMTTELITGSPEDLVENVMGVITTKRIRHLPVLSEGRLVGIISIGDIVKAQHDRLAMENRFMKDYIRG